MGTILHANYVLALRGECGCGCWDALQLVIPEWDIAYHWEPCVCLGCRQSGRPCRIQLNDIYRALVRPLCADCLVYAERVERSRRAAREALDLTERRVVKREPARRGRSRSR